LAIELSRRPRPADLRAAVGRAYYSAFNAAAEMIRSCGLAIFQSPAGHGDLLRYLGNSGDSDLISAGHKLSRLRSRRNVADYDLSAVDVENQSTVQSLVQLAGQLLETFEKCQFGERRVRMIAALEEYRRRIAPPPPSP
jgi:uncharacterized protein (UPF0332 family)